MKNVPQRMCIACRQMKNKAELIRIVKNGEAISVDRTGKAAVRGAYICCDKECIEKAAKQKILNRAFKCEVPREIYLKLEEHINEQ